MRKKSFLNFKSLLVFCVKLQFSIKMGWVQLLLLLRCYVNWKPEPWHWASNPLRFVKDSRISKTLYFLCYALTTNKGIFESLHNIDSPKEYLPYCIHGTLFLNMTADSLIRNLCFLGIKMTKWLHLSPNPGSAVQCSKDSNQEASVSRQERCFN